MSFWDSSAIVPLCINENRSQSARRLWRLFRERVVWREAAVEVESALARLEREGKMDADVRLLGQKHLNALSASWIPISSSERTIDIARTLPGLYGLRSLDSLQLAAALVWCNEFPKNKDFIAGDARLLIAAKDVGFTIHDLA